MNRRKLGPDGFSMQTRPIMDRFWLKVSVLGPDDCWEWTGKRRAREINGQPFEYGVFWLPQVKGFPRREIRAHRFAWEIWHQAPVPSGLSVLHSCDNPPCVNPAHLRPGTPAENVADMTERGRHWAHSRTHCPNGHNLSLPNATKIVRRAGRPDENACVACAQERSRRWSRKARAA